MAETYAFSDQKFVNPYHFVPVEAKRPERVDISAVLKKKGLLSGWIECTLTTKSPLFVPNSSQSDRFGKMASKEAKSYDFASYKDLSPKAEKAIADVTFKTAPAEPIIPGSELRGVIRTAYEAVTNSCLSIVDDEKMLYKRLSKPRFPGVLQITGSGENRKYELSTECNREKLREKLDDAMEGASYKGGWVHIGEYNILPLRKGPRRGQETGRTTVIIKKRGKTTVQLEKEAFDRFLYSLKLYDDPKVNQHHKTKNGKHGGYKHVKPDKTAYALFYLKTGPYYYLSPAQIGRDVFFNTVSKLIRPSGHQPCTDITKVCPACALFGFVGEERGRSQALSGRVRFSDARLAESKTTQELFYAPRWLPELSSPKPSSTEFYLKKPPQTADFWTYDYAVCWNTGSKGDFKVVNGYKPELSGRKFYWHDLSKNSDPASVSDDKATTRNVYIRPLRPDITFAFNVHFDRITADELRTLLWVLTIGGSEKCGHKLGMGKPVGYGSVQIAVKNVWQRTLGAADAAYGFVSLRDTLMKDLDTAVPQTDAVKAFLTITQMRPAFSLQNIPVAYPSVVCAGDKAKEAEIFRWFVGNKSSQEKKTSCGDDANSTSKPVITQTLPPISAPLLKKYIVSSGGSSGRSQGGQGRPYQGGGGNRSQGDWRRQSQGGGGRQNGSSGPRTLSDAERGKRGKDKNDGGYSDRYTWSHR